jgi:hypothetical protein
MPTTRSANASAVLRLVDRARRLGWPLLVFAVFLGVNGPLLRGRAVGIWDAGNQAFPYFVLVADHARAGHLVRWDPWTESGQPLDGEPQAGAYSPIVISLGLLGGGRSSTFIAYWLLSWGLGAAGVLALGRHFGAPRWGACAVALGYLFCGVYIGNAEHTSWVVAFSFLPLVLWRLDVALVRRSTLPAAQAGALWGLGALAGHPSIIILGGCYAALWTLGRVLFGAAPLGAAAPNDERSSSARPAGSTRGERPLTPLRALGTLTVLGVVGALVLSPTYTSTLADGAGVHSRSGPLPKAEAVTDEFPPGGLATIASAYPLRAKFYLRDVLWPRSDVSMVSVYAGVLVPVLALFSLVVRSRDRWRWWIAMLAVFSLACAMGETLPLHGWLYDWFYPIRFFRHSSVFRLFYIVSVTVLALLGTRELALALDARDERRLRLFAATSLASAFVATVVFERFLYGIRDLTSGRLAPLVIATWLGPVGLAVFLLVRRAPRLSSILTPALVVLVAVCDAIATSLMSRHTMVDTAAEVTRWHELDRRHSASLDLAPHGLDRRGASCDDWDPTRWCDVNDQMITKIPVQHADSPFKNAIYRLFLEDSAVRAMAAGRDRIWFSPSAAQVPRTDSAVAVFMRAARSAGAPSIVVHRRGDMVKPVTSGGGSGVDQTALEARIRALPAARRIDVELLAYTPNELALAVSASQPGWLLVTDRWAPGWRATVNGRPEDVLGAAFVYRAVPVVAGRNAVRFTYRSSAFPLLVIASWGTLALVLLVSVRRSPRVDRLRDDGSEASD